MNKQWFHAGPHAARGAHVLKRDHSQPNRNLQAPHNLQVNKEAQELKRAKTDLLEAQRRIARQIVLIGELADRGEAILEPEKALVRLQTKMLESRSRHDQLLNRRSFDTKANSRSRAALDRTTA